MPEYDDYFFGKVAAHAYVDELQKLGLSMADITGMMSRGAGAVKGGLQRAGKWAKGVYNPASKGLESKSRYKRIAGPGQPFGAGFGG